MDANCIFIQTLTQKRSQIQVTHSLLSPRCVVKGLNVFEDPLSCLLSGCTRLLVNDLFLQNWEKALAPGVIPWFAHCWKTELKSISTNSLHYFLGCILITPFTMKYDPLWNLPTPLYWWHGFQNNICCHAGLLGKTSTRLLWTSRIWHKWSFPLQWGYDWYRWPKLEMIVWFLYLWSDSSIPIPSPCDYRLFPRVFACNG